MKGEQVLNRYRVMIREAALIERELTQTPELYGSTESERAKEREHWEKHFAGLETQLAQLRQQIRAEEKGYQTCVDRCRRPTTRRVLRLYYGMGMTDAQVAEHLGLGAHTVAKYRCRFVRELNAMREV